MTTASPSTTDSISCSVQAHLPAAAFCTVCKRPYAGRFLSVLNDGRAVCFRCASDRSLATLGAPEPEDDYDGIGERAFQKGLLRAIPFILLKPAKAIGTAPAPNARLWPALRFGFLASLVGRFATVAWLFAIDKEGAMKAIESRMERMGAAVTEDQVRTAIWTSLPIAVALSMMVGIALFHLGLRISGATGTFREHARAYALGSAALLFGLLPPPLGLPMICLAWMSAMMVWARARYGFSGFRAALALIPTLLLMLTF